jgi:hypothetical protein
LEEELREEDGGAMETQIQPPIGLDSTVKQFLTNALRGPSSRQQAATTSLFSVVEQVFNHAELHGITVHSYYLDANPEEQFDFHSGVVDLSHASGHRIKVSFKDTTKEWKGVDQQKRDADVYVLEAHKKAAFIQALSIEKFRLMEASQMRFERARYLLKSRDLGVDAADYTDE